MALEKAAPRVRKALVTGAAGFLGSHLVDRLLADGFDVVGLDNLQTGQRKNLAHLAHRNNFHFINHDVVDPIDIEVDEIYSLACPASPIHYQADPVKTFKTSVLGTLNLLELARKYNAKIMQASTSEVYGDPLQHPQREDYWGHVNPIGIRACYDEGKRGAETLCFDFKRSYGVDARVVRIFNTYGPRMHPEDGRVVSNFINQALRGEDITIYGEGRQTRSFCYVDDLISGFRAMMSQEQPPSGPVNLGNPVEFDMLYLAELVLSLTGSKSKLIYAPLPEDDPQMRLPDIHIAMKTLCWSPKIELREGLQRTISFFQFPSA
jgi:UDP-glucuronate decarboxylase